jgi:carbamoylphosphate synthase small subunit
MAPTKAKARPARAAATTATDKSSKAWPVEAVTALLVLADGTVIEGRGLGAEGTAVGEVCFNTAMTGYEEILTDPSYAGQIITFTFPHIGNVGTNEEDIETSNLAAASGVRGAVLATGITEPSNWRAAKHFDQWLKARGIVAIAGIDTRALTSLIREKGMANAVIAHDPAGRFDRQALKAEAAAWPGLVGMDLAREVSCLQRYEWDETLWAWPAGHGRQTEPRHHVVEAGKPIFGICLGHQMLALALGARTVKMHQGHHGANHPVKDHTTGKVEITSMNHGFTVDRDSLTAAVEETHVSLFDGSNCGIALKGAPVFSVQYHPEASPGPQDSHYLFQRFVDLIEAEKKA